MENSAPESLIALEKHPKEAQSSTTKENLVRINTLLESQINTTQSLITSLGETDTNSTYLSELKDGLKLLQKHVEFTLDALNSSPEQFNKILQEKYHDLSPGYVKLSTIEDINLVMLNYILDFIANDLLLKFQDALDTLSKNIKSQQEKPELVNINETFDWIQILIFRLNLVNESYPCSVTYSKTDLFSFPKTSQVWQELEKVLVVKKVATKEDVEKELDLIFSSLRSMYAILKTRTEGVENPEFPSTFGLIKESIKYRKTPTRTKILSLLYLRNPNFDAFRAIKLADDPWIEKLAILRQQHVGYDKCIYVPRDFPAITKELLIKEYEEKTLNKLHSNHSQHEKHNEENAPKIQEPPANLFLQTEETIRVRILAPEPLNLQNSFGEKISTVFHKARKLVSKKQNGPEQNCEAIVIHIHGGGFVAGSSAAHRIYLNHWVNNLKMVHFSIDYRLAPEHRYPAALDDVWQAYLWIINNATPVLGIRYQKIIITGDSAGGNLATALTYRLLRAGLRAPDGCLLLYPSVLRITNLCSPSSLFSLDDPIIPYRLHRLFNQAYMPEGYEPNMEDPFLRPLLASDEMLSSLPPVRVVIGSADLLHDNCLRFVDRLRKLNKEVKMVVYESLPHGFYNMSDLKCYQQVNDETCDLVRELCALADRKDV